MESAVRYDFSFPPKSSNNNLMQNGNNNMGGHVVHNQGQVHTIHNMRSNQNQVHHDQKFNYVNSHSNNIGLPKSASTSLLSTCAASSNNANPKLNNNYCNSCNNCNNIVKETINNNNMMQNNLNMQKNCMGSNNNMSQKHLVKPANLLLQNQQMGHGNQISHSVGRDGPQTPKDSNCSFTFDDLKNTLAFMEDSPLVKQIDNSSSHLTSSVNVNAVNNVQLMVNPNTGSGAESGSLSSSSSVSSSSSSSCNSCCAPGYLPKSNSNPMLLSLATTTSSSSITSGSSAGSIAPLSPNNNQKFPQGNSVLDLLINKRSPDNIENTSHYNTENNSYVSSTNTSLITVANQNNSQISTTNTLLTSVNHVNQQQNNTGGINSAVETAAKKYRCAAQISEATCCWKGKLPPKQYKTPIVYSTKVFVGGLPWDITEEDIVKEFGVFGPCRVEWTNKEKFNMNQQNNQQNNQHNNNLQHNENYENNQNHQNQNIYNNGYQNNYRNNNRHSMNGNMQLNSSNVNINGQNQNSDPLNSSKHRLSPGFAYVIYESEYSVRSLVGNCIEDYQNGRDRVEYYFKISTRRVRNKEVQIIPWILADNNFALCTPKELDPKKTVFVGNLHGTMTARDLAHIMNELFGCVVYAGIDIDKLKYPIGSGRVTFSHQQNFMRAVRAAFVDIQSSKFSKRIQIDPYLEDVQCCLCYGDKGIYFCRDFQCFNYYCGGCWEKQHSYNQLGNHKPLMRKREDKLMN
jgi:cytoplasmic polyadenylation element-binding protein